MTEQEYQNEIVRLRNYLIEINAIAYRYSHVDAYMIKDNENTIQAICNAIGIIRDRTDHAAFGYISKIQQENCGITWERIIKDENSLA